MLSVAVSDGLGTFSWWIESPDDLRAAASVLRSSPAEASEAGLRGPTGVSFGNDQDKTPGGVLGPLGDMGSKPITPVKEVHEPSRMVSEENSERCRLVSHLRHPPEGTSNTDLPSEPTSQRTLDGSQSSIGDAVGLDSSCDPVRPDCEPLRSDRRLEEEVVASRSVATEGKIIVHFAPMEGRWRTDFFGEDKKVVAKTMIDTALIAFRVDPGQPMKLASVAARHLPEFSGWKTETESLLIDLPSMLEMPREEVLKRNAVDAFVTYKLFEKLWPMLTEEERQLHEEDVAISMLNARMARRGMLLDEDGLIKKRKELEAEMVLSQKGAAHVCGIPEINPNSGPQVGKILEERGAYPPFVQRTDGGAYPTDEITLRSIHHVTTDANTKEFISNVIRFKKAQTILSRYVTGYAQARDADGRVRSSLFWPGTTTYRPASHDPNLLNVPRRGVRHLFVAPPGFSFIEFDLAQAELRVSAAVSRDPLLVSAFQRGGSHVDLHSRRAEKIYLGTFNPKDKDQRYVGKKINFSTEYGAGDEALWEALVKEDVHVPMELVSRGRLSFWQDHKVLRKYREEVMDRGRRGDTIFAPTGGYHWNLEQMRLLHPKDEHEALSSLFNASIQSVPQRIMYRAGLRLEDNLELVLSVYDSLMGYVRTEDALEMARHGTKIINEVVAEETWLGDIELPADCKIGRSWGEAVEVKPDQLLLEGVI